MEKLPTALSDPVIASLVFRRHTLFSIALVLSNKTIYKMLFLEAPNSFIIEELSGSLHWSIALYFITV